MRKTIEQACAESQAETAKWFAERNRKALELVATLPENVPVIYRDVTQKDPSLNFGQDLIILGYNTTRVENRGAVYIYQGLASDLRAPGEDVAEKIQNRLEQLRKEGIKPRAVFWGFGNAYTDKDKAVAEKIKQAVLRFSEERTYQENEEAIKTIDRLFTGRISEKSIGTQLEQLFAGRLDKGTLETLTQKVDAQLQRVTTETGSVGVVAFRSGGKKGYGKVSTNTASLRNEHQALKAVREDGLARILAPVPIGLALTEEAGALFTWGTENREMYNSEDVQRYTALFNTLLFQYAERKGLNLRVLAKDTKYQDVFNRALIHSGLREFKAVYETPVILGVQEVKERAKINPALLTQLKQFDKVYAEAIERIQGTDLGQRVFVHGDARPENIGKDPFAIRPLVDWANARMGYGVEDLAALETEDSSRYTDWYNFVMDIRGGKTLTPEDRKALTCFEVLQPYRTSTFKISKGRYKEAQRDLARLERNTRRYKETFSS